MNWILRYICLEYLFPSFNPEVMSIFEASMRFLDVAEGWVLFFISVLLVCIFFIAGLSLLTTRSINEQVLLIYFLLQWCFIFVFDCIVCVHACVRVCTSPLLACRSGAIYFLGFLECGQSLQAAVFPSSPFYSTGFVERWCLNLAFIMESFIFTIYCD